MSFDFDASLSKSFGVEHTVVVERVVPGNLDERRRQSLERLRQNRRVPPVAVVGRVELVEPLHIGGGQDERIRVCLARLGVDRADHRIQQGLVPDDRTLVLSRHQSDDRGEVATGTLAHHADAAGVGAELVGMPGRPDQDRVAVFDAGGERMLGSQPIIDRDDHGIRALGDGAAHPVATAQITEHEAAAVEVQDERSPEPFDRLRDRATSGP